MKSISPSHEILSRKKAFRDAPFKLHFEMWNTATWRSCHDAKEHLRRGVQRTGYAEGRPHKNIQDMQEEPPFNQCYNIVLSTLINA